MELCFDLKSKTELSVAKAQKYIGAGGTAQKNHILGGGTPHLLPWWRNNWGGGKHILGGGTPQILCWSWEHLGWWHCTTSRKSIFEFWWGSDQWELRDRPSNIEVVRLVGKPVPDNNSTTCGSILQAGTGTRFSALLRIQDGANCGNNKDVRLSY